MFSGKPMFINTKDFRTLEIDFSVFKASHLLVVAFYGCGADLKVLSDLSEGEPHFPTIVPTKFCEVIGNGMRRYGTKKWINVLIKKKIPHSMELCGTKFWRREGDSNPR